MNKKVEVIKANRTIADRNHATGMEQIRVAAYCRVSTDSEDQLSSYKSQVAHYTQTIQENKEWVLVDIYADEAITGTQITKRTDFQRLLNDCMNGEIDMVITKSISRFARNTLDTLKYVRMLKEKNIAVLFEDEKINTLTMDGELLLVVLSSVAQQEVENISANVKKGLKMKMQRGELVGFQGCLGYDYHPDTKTITVNEKEAVIVKYIFNRYIEGAGARIIGNELEELGYKTNRGNSKWHESTVLGIIKNEKYKGDLLLGKTFTVDPISKRRLTNFGEEDQFYLKDNHEPIISVETYEKAHEILNRRSYARGKFKEGDKRKKYSRQFAFSCMLECGYCGGTLTRRRWHSGTPHEQTIWQCVVATKKGRAHCQHSKGIPEIAIEQAFVESYRLLCQDNKEVFEDFIVKLEETLSQSSVENDILKINKELSAIGKKLEKLVELKIEDKIDNQIYEDKYISLNEKADKLRFERNKLSSLDESEKISKRRIEELRVTLSQNQVLDHFDRHVYESVVEKVIVGGYEEDGTMDPYKLTFVYKTGMTNNQKGGEFKPQRRNNKTNSDSKESLLDVCSQVGDEDENVHSLPSDHTC